MSGNSISMKKSNETRKVMKRLGFIVPPLWLCDCGCRSIVYGGKRFIDKHGGILNRGKPSPMKGRHQTENQKLIVTESSRNRVWTEQSKKKNREKHMKKHVSPKTEFTSERLKGNTYVKDAINRNPEVLKKMLRCSKPNYRELQLQSLLNTLYPNQWKYVGDGSIIIEGKNPDFINCNGKKLIIELFGEHWHERGEEETRTNMFKQYGYDTLIIWAKELNKQNELEIKLKEFMEKHK